MIGTDLSAAETDRPAKPRVLRRVSGTVPAASKVERRATAMNRFTALLDADPDRLFDVTGLCRALGVSERTVRTCCDQILATSPVKYLRLRRMQMARRALCSGDPARTTVTQIATAHGFFELGRFAVRYRTMFGESPSATLGRPPNRVEAISETA